MLAGGKTIVYLSRLTAQKGTTSTSDDARLGDDLGHR